MIDLENALLSMNEKLALYKSRISANHKRNKSTKKEDDKPAEDTKKKKNTDKKETSKNVVAIVVITLVVFMFATIARNFIYHYRKISSALVYMETLEDKLKLLFENSPEENYNQSLNKFNQSLCAICLIDFVNDDKVRKLPLCSHIFHSKCIDMWINSKTEKAIHCPLCNTCLIDSWFEDCSDALDTFPYLNTY
eukprot:TRINITY_DN2739_c0_g2_i2.p1 TRINITY_DN2739_c0_g2~~TRINITY_DN2739_c0_g2_i2.p1  ORF type:complete len:194 (-),score=40.93 TRINITY_DN2739_c0_g2_i2:62-643(-)